MGKRRIGDTKQLLVHGCCGIFVLALGEVPRLDSDTDLRKEISCLFPRKFTYWVILLCSIFSMTTSKVINVDYISLGVIDVAHFLLVSACWGTKPLCCSHRTHCAFGWTVLQNCRKLLLCSFSGTAICHTKNTKVITGYKPQTYIISFLVCPHVPFSTGYT